MESKKEKTMKGLVKKSETFDLLEIRLGRIVSVEFAHSAPKPSYKITCDFGKFGRKITVGRFTRHSPEELDGLLVFGILNFDTITIGEILSEFLLLGVQYPKADSGEATIVTVANNKAKIGTKIF